MKELIQKRVVLITGKGGVGRSSVAAALAHVAHRAGKRVLLTEMGDGSGDYSALAKLFGLNQLPMTASTIAPGILGSQLLPEKGVELFLTSVIRIPALVRLALSFEPLRRLSTATPSLRELGIFFHLLVYLRAQTAGAPQHELIIIDMPATGHTLALTGLPAVVLRLISTGPIADSMREGQSYLNNPERAGAYVITLPETLPITEALELLAGLEKTAVPRGGLIVNRMPTDEFSPAERSALDEYIQHQPMFGTEAFLRIAEAHRAVDRLHASTAVPAVQLAESPLLGNALIQSLADALEVEVVGSRS